MSTLLDWDQALANADGSEELLMELAQVLIETCPAMLQEVRDAIDKRDAAVLQRAAHSLKGSARVFAAGPATEAALRLELMGADANFEGVDDAWDTLVEEIEQLMAVIADKVGQQDVDGHGG